MELILLIKFIKATFLEAFVSLVRLLVANISRLRALLEMCCDRDRNWEKVIFYRLCLITFGAIVEYSAIGLKLRARDRKSYFFRFCPTSPYLDQGRLLIK